MSHNHSTRARSSTASSSSRRVARSKTPKVSKVKEIPSDPVQVQAAPSPHFISPLLTTRKSNKNKQSAIPDYVSSSLVTSPSKNKQTKDTSSIIAPVSPVTASSACSFFSFVIRLLLFFFFSFLLSFTVFICLNPARYESIRSFSHTGIKGEIEQFFSLALETVRAAVKEIQENSVNSGVIEDSASSISARIPSTLSSLSLSALDFPTYFGSLDSHFQVIREEEQENLTSATRPLVFHFAFSSSQRLDLTFDQVQDCPQLKRIEQFCSLLTSGLFQSPGRLLTLPAHYKHPQQFRTALQSHFSSSPYGIVSFLRVPPRHFLHRSMLSELQFLIDEADAPYKRAIFVFLTDVPNLSTDQIPIYDLSSVENMARNVYRDLWNRTDLGASNPLELIEPLLARMVRNTIWIRDE
jgi:hypothetical protein